MLRKGLFLLLITLLNACTSGDLAAQAKAPTEPQSNHLQGKSAPVDPPAQVRQTAPCAYPADWQLYQMQVNETVYSIALRTGISAEELFRLNCSTVGAAFEAGAWLYVPPTAIHNRPETLLPLGIGALVADPVQVAAGGTVNLTWLAAGPVVNVRAGWQYQGQFIEEASALPTIGTLAVQVPADGRESITLVVRASDGVHEVTAQTTVRIACPESWFFSPAPVGCPTPPMVTTFHEQPFERGTVIYIPALGQHLVLINGQAGLRMVDTFVPGMPLNDPALDSEIPAGLLQPSGPIYYAWRSDDHVMAALGYATAPETSYTGMMQRRPGINGEVLYLSSSSGAVVQFANGQGWQTIVPQ
ncbi:MAG TPA: hypothetical protein VHP83_13765 [Aggregatilineaceae bacterium]|nr:hypothetical protein [Aggregatilineaceae bacterium]